jgi:hypothetical protein
MRRILILVGTLAAIAAMLFGLPNFTVQTSQFPNAIERVAKARDLTLVCPGALWLTGGTSGTQIGKFTKIGAETENLHFDNSSKATLEISDGSFTAVDPQGRATQGSNLLAVNQLQLASLPGFSGLTGATCQKPSTDIWLIGGSTEVGNETLLVLRNPSRVNSTVELQVFTEAGQLRAAGLAGIAVGAQKTTVLNLAGLIPKTKTFAVRALARGGAVGAWLQHRVVRGLEAGGSDYVSPAQPAAKSQVMTGLFIRGSKDNSALISQSDSYSNLRPTLRVFNSQKQTTTFTAQVVSADSKSFGTVIRAQVEAESVADFTISGLTDGDYVVAVTADQPIQTGLKFSRTFKERNPKTDFAWLTSLELHTESQTIALPSGGITKFSWYSPVSGKVITRELGQGGKYQFAANEAGYFASLVVDINGQITVLPVTNARNVGGQVAISLR